jgi:hypothetical protein
MSLNKLINSTSATFSERSSKNEVVCVLAIYTAN